MSEENLCRCETPWGNPGGKCLTCKKVIDPKTEVFESENEIQNNDHESRSINCQNCQELNHSTFKFCRTCGEEIKKPKYFCGNCGSQNTFEVSHCQNCDSSLIAQREVLENSKINTDYFRNPNFFSKKKNIIIISVLAGALAFWFLISAIMQPKTVIVKEACPYRAGTIGAILYCRL